MIMAMVPTIHTVVPGLVPGIHVFLAALQVVDGRARPGHDDAEGVA
jgi:hypothetical protein